MTPYDLTRGTPFDTSLDDKIHRRPILTKANKCRAGILCAATLGLSSCVNINAPDDAIVIELNINITQEVIYRLAADAGDTIEDNADIF